MLVLTGHGLLALAHARQQRLLGGDEEDALLGLLGRAHAQLARQEVHAPVRVLAPHLRTDATVGFRREIIRINDGRDAPVRSYEIS